MTKLAKNYYYDKNGERKINCYLINIPKKIVKLTDIKDTDNVKVYAQENKIIIEKSNL